MNLIATVRYIESRFNKDKSGQGQGRPAKKDDRKKSREETHRLSSDSRLGQKIDTTA